MKSFSKTRVKQFIIPIFEEYGDLINIGSIGLAIIESILLGLHQAIPAFFAMIAILLSITLARFFTVSKSKDTGQKQQIATIYNWTIYSSLLTGSIWGCSSFFLPGNEPSLFVIHSLFLLMIGTSFAIFFSCLPIISTALTIIVLAPVTLLLFLNPTSITPLLPFTILFVSISLILFSLIHGKVVRGVYNQLSQQRKIRLQLLARDNDVKILEQMISKQEKINRHREKGSSHSKPPVESFLQSPNEAVALLTIDGHILETNDLFRKITGYQKIQVGSTIFSDLFPQKMIDNLNMALQTSISTGREISFTITHLEKLRHVLFMPLLDSDNTVLNVTVIFEDVRKQKDRNDMIGKNNRLWDTILALTSESVSQQTWQSCFSPTLPALRRSLGADRIFIVRENGESINNSNLPVNNDHTHSYHWIFSVGSWMSTLYRGNTIHNVNSSFSEMEKSILENKEVQTLALVPVFRNDMLWGILGVIKTDTSDYFTYQQMKVLSFLRNILSLHVLNEKSRSEMKRLKTVVEQSEDCIIITDPKGIIQYTNPACESVTGYASMELADEKAQQLHMDDNQTRIWREIDTALQKKEKWHGQFINKRKDKTLYEEEMILSPVYDPDEIMVNLVIIKRNITEAKRLESIAEAANLMDNIGFIFTSLRHELGNPINSLKVSLSILESNLDNYKSDDIKRFLSRNLSDIKRVEYLLTTLKNFSVFEKPRIGPVNMEEMLDGFTNLIKPDIEKKDIKVILHISEKNIIGLIDPRAFQQVLLNLATNAMDALENTLNKRITITMYKEENNQINLSIGDNGCGIDESEQQNLFRPFFTTKQKGTGLGLVIVKKMLSKMNCSIDIHSKKSVGTQVFIIIPGQTNPDALRTG